MCHARPEVHIIQAKEVQTDTSTGFHLLELHMPTLAKGGAAIVLMIVVGLVLLLCGKYFIKKCFASRRAIQVQPPAPQPQQNEDNSLLKTLLPFLLQRPVQTSIQMEPMQRFPPGDIEDITPDAPQAATQNPNPQPPKGDSTKSRPPLYSY